MGVHDGHRERLKERFIEHGLNDFNEINALELLLFYAIPRKDTNPIAHELLKRFGSLHGVFDASARELSEVNGIGENAAVLIRLIPQIVRKSLVTESNSRPYLKDTGDLAAFLVPRYMFEKEELALMLCLDSNKRLISCIEISRGVVNAVELNVRRMAEIALKNRASYVVMSHNHPDSIAMSSREDDHVTKLAYTALRTIGIELVDHIIVAGDEYLSYAQSGAMRMLGK